MSNGGTESYVFNLAAALKKHECNVLILTPFINLNNYVQNISSSTSPFEEEYFSYLAIRNANNSDRIRELIINPDFLKSSSSIKDCFNFLTLQSLLMHNGEGIVGLQTIEGLTSEQDEKKNIVLKNVAIASLINTNLHDQAKEILDGFQSTQFDDQDKESIKNSFKLLAIQIEKSISENQFSSKSIQQINFSKSISRINSENQFSKSISAN